MKKITFTHSYFLRFDPKQWAINKPYPPLGPLYAAAVMEKKGYNISFHDSMFSNDPSELCISLFKYNPDFLVIYDDGFNYLTKMCLSNMKQAAFKMIQLAKKTGCKIIISSSDSTDHYEEYLLQGADIVLIGEAENTLPELVEYIIAGHDNYSVIKGIAYQSGNGTIKTQKKRNNQESGSLTISGMAVIFTFFAASVPMIAPINKPPNIHP